MMKVVGICHVKKLARFSVAEAIAFVSLLALVTGLSGSIMPEIQKKTVSGLNWGEWWTYDGISGPSFWGLINPEWSLCNSGLRQSPVDIDPQDLLFDPHLDPVYINPARVKGTVKNNGHTITFQVEHSNHHMVNISGASLSYHYQVSSIVLHWGEDMRTGSEHSINHRTYPAELQILGYNGDLYVDETESFRSPNGAVGVAVLLQVGDRSNPELRRITDAAGKIKFAGESAEASSVSIAGLLPDTPHLLTYSGSLTAPSCRESVTWLLPNKPIYITRQQLEGLTKLMQGEVHDPRAPLSNNYRPTQPLNGRLVRTNINFNTTAEDCDALTNPLKYKVNE